MLAILAGLTAAFAIATIWPELPFGKGVTNLAIKLVTALQSTGLQARVLLAIGAALALYAAIWALAGDAPMFLAMILPELAAWFTTFEIATLAEALLGMGTAVFMIRSAGAANYLKGRLRARRTRRIRAASRTAANDDEPGGLPIAA